MSQPSDNSTFNIPGDLPRATGLLVASAVGGEGKTVIAAAIARSLRSDGHDVEVFLPVATGCRADRGGLISDSADILAACAESRRTLAEISPVRLASSQAPAASAAIGGPAVDVGAIFDAWQGLAGDAGCVVVEAPGGLASPITDDFRTIDLAKLLALPVVLVVKAEPDALARAMLAVDVANSHGLALVGCVLNCFTGDSAGDEPVDENLRSLPVVLERVAGLKTLALVPRDSANNIPAGRIARSTCFAVDQVHWDALWIGAKR